MTDDTPRGVAATPNPPAANASCGASVALPGTRHDRSRNAHIVAQATEFGLIFRNVGCEGRAYKMLADCLHGGILWNFAMNLQSIVHPTDFSDLSVDAFVHALRIALTAKSKLYLLHVETGHESKWGSFPHVRHALALWKLMTEDVTEKHAQAAIEAKVGVRVVKVSLDRQDPVHGILSFLDRHPTELIVLATHGRDGLPRWLHGSVAELVSRRAAKPTVFIAPGTRGFVDESSGQLRLRQVLIPVDHAPEPSAALNAIGEFVQLLAGRDLAVHLLHVGTLAPAVPRASPTAMRMNLEVRRGDVVETILQTAAEIDADLIAMPTAGHHGILDALRGSTTERVLRHAGCPVLAMPAS
jgi:nucleotide-binding universal stress UspA family protein